MDSRVGRILRTSDTPSASRAMRYSSVTP
jgi:hypothetical protein